MKDKNRIFSTPSIDLDLVESPLSHSWKILSKTLGKWKNLFDLSKEARTTNSSKKSSVISLQDPISQLKDKTVKLSHKTPSKRKFDRLQVTIPKSEMLNRSKLDTKIEGQEALDTVKDVLVNSLLEFEDKMNFLSQAIEKLSQDFEQSVTD